MTHFAAALAAILLAAPLTATHPPAPAGSVAVTGTLAGRVTSAETGDALPGAIVNLAGTRFGATADAAGRYRIVAPAGVYRVEARLAGYEPLSVDEVEIAEGETLPLDLALDFGYDRDPEDVVRPRPERGRDGAEERAGPPSPPPSPAPATGMSGAVGAATGDGAGARYREPEAAPGERTAAPGDHWDRSGLLTAGDVDDHLNFDYYLRYVRRALQRDAAQAFPTLDLRDRVTILIRDRSGRPASNARVRVIPAGGRGRTIDLEAGTDGRLHLYPARDLGRGVRQARLDVRPPSGGAVHSERIDLPRAGAGPITVRVPARASLPATLDLAIVLDVTGSMGDEHRYLSDEFESIVARVRRRYPQVDLRFALVAYRDHGDEFVVRSYGFTSSVREMQRRLTQQRAAGGGDYPEALDEALAAGVGLNWRRGNAARVLFLVADAPPHNGRFEAAMRHVDAARAAGIRIYPIAASGVGDGAEYLMRAAAVLTQGRHLFLTDDSGIGRPHEEPKVACFVVTPLDRQIARVIEGELGGRRVEPDGQDIVRQVGRYDNGVCRDQPVTYVPEGQW